jgi:D-sedoheptulose 7-phosphate isomerase
MQKQSLLDDFRSYFGLIKGGVNLRQSLLEIPLLEVNALYEAIKTLPSNGRVFFMGNGGSFDNSRWMALMLRRINIKAKVPGFMDDYFHNMYSLGYGEIYAAALKADELTSADIVVGISCSGNSQNVLRGLEFASQAGAKVFGLGGRDGGKMKNYIPEKNLLIVHNRCMEAVEDLHNFVFYMVLHALKDGISLKGAHSKILKIYDDFLSDQNLIYMQEIAFGLIHSMCRQGHAFILGLGLGANHFRADMGRGATNALPIRGLSTPEVFNINSAEATANDDGPDFILVDGLVKYSPEDKDFAILCDIGEHHELFDHCIELLESSGTRYIEIGTRQLLTTCFEREERDLPVMLIGHACGEVLREFFQAQFSIRELSEVMNYSGENKKIGAQETKKLEEELLSSGVLHEGESITFSYGKIFAVKCLCGEYFERCFF